MINLFKNWVLLSIKLVKISHSIPFVFWARLHMYKCFHNLLWRQKQKQQKQQQRSHDDLWSQKESHFLALKAAERISPFYSSWYNKHSVWKPQKKVSFNILHSKFTKNAKNSQFVAKQYYQTVFYGTTLHTVWKLQKSLIQHFSTFFHQKCQK